MLELNRDFVGYRKPAQQKKLNYLEFLYAMYRKRKWFMFYGSMVSKIYGYKYRQAGNQIISDSIKVGLFEYASQQKFGKGGVRYSAPGEDSWASNVYKNLNKELVLEYIKILREKLGLEQVVYDAKKCDEILEKWTNKINLTELEKAMAKEFQCEVDEYNARVGEKAKVRFLQENKKRGYSALCSTKNPEKHPEDTSREDFLNKYLNPKYFGFDVNCSMYRVNYNLCHDVLMDRNTDFYAYLYDYMFKNTLKNREGFKALLMPCYMKGEGYVIKADNLNRVKQLVADFEGEVMDSEDEALYQYALSLDKIMADTGFSSYEDILKHIYESFKFLYGDCFRKRHIFIDETFIMIIMANLLYKKYGRKALYLYDCLYIEGEEMSKDDLYDLYEEATWRYKTIYNMRDKEIKERKAKKREKKELVTSILKSVYVCPTLKAWRAKVRYLLNKGLSVEQVTLQIC